MRRLRLGEWEQRAQRHTANSGSWKGSFSPRHGRPAAWPTAAVPCPAGGAHYHPSPVTTAGSVHGLDETAWRLPKEGPSIFHTVSRSVLTASMWIVRAEGVPVPRVAQSSRQCAVRCSGRVEGLVVWSRVVLDTVPRKVPRRGRRTR